MILSASQPGKKESSKHLDLNPRSNKQNREISEFIIGETLKTGQDKKAPSQLVSTH